MHGGANTASNIVLPRGSTATAYVQPWERDYAICGEQRRSPQSRPDLLTGLAVIGMVAFGLGIGF